MTAIDVVIFLLLLGGSAFCSASETALTAVSDVAVHLLAEKGSRLALLIKKLVADRRRVIAALLVGNNIVNAVLAIYATRVFDQGLAQSGIMSPELAAVAAGATSIVSLLVFGEILPKSVAVSFSLRVAMWVAYPVWLMVLALTPVIVVLNAISGAVLRLLGHDGKVGNLTLDEIRMLARIGKQQGVIDQIEGKIVERASEINDIRVREIMVPRTDIHAVKATSTIAELREIFRRDLFSRMPVYLGDIDDFIGVLHFKEILRLTPAEEAKFKLQDYLHPTLFVPGAMFCGDLLEKMREKRSHLAIVLDEYGGTAGLVTLEDIIEELVGRIEDEYDVSAALVKRRPDGDLEVDGRLGIEEFETALGLKLAEEAHLGAETVAGLALKAFGKIPAEGDRCSYHGLELTALRVRDLRVRRVLVHHESDVAGDLAATVLPTASSGDSFYGDETGMGGRLEDSSAALPRPTSDELKKPDGGSKA
ncbi:MAG: HlyC/CorC family transporter [Planctomycetes bacterium]|nr:HlyC/CorC family transporter [Planctomycetota bacterium]